MEHLTLEDLARLVDFEATPDEARHLAVCAHCQTELDALRDQTAALGALAEIAPPPGLRASLEARLADEGLIRGKHHRWRIHPGAVTRIAAAFALFMLGTATGAVVAAPMADRVTAPISVQTSNGATPGPTVDTVDDLRRAEAEYLRALTRYAEQTDAGDALHPLSRLAALEGIVVTTRAALETAPADPVINNYLLTAMSQREALLRRLEQGSSVDEWF